jgi:transposase InsO family protein
VVKFGDGLGEAFGRVGAAVVVELCATVLHGLSSTIISDRDLVFTSKFWRSLFKLVGIELKLSSFYHPQTDGQTKRVN